MGTKLNKLIDSNSATVFLFAYGLIIQIVALPIIYFFITHYPVRMPLVEAFVFIWYCIPVLAVFSVITSVIQIKRRISGKEQYQGPLIGLILNSIWLTGYLIVIYLAFVVKIPFLFTE